MRIVKNRTGNQLKRPLRILSILRGRWDGQRFPALQALADIGHEVIYVDQLLNLEGYRKLIKKIKFDIAVLWGTSLENILRSYPGPFFLEDNELPYVSLWTDNPIKHQYFLKAIQTPLHRGVFVADRRVVEQLKQLGWQNIFYLPPWHIDQEIYRPVQKNAEVNYVASFAATVNSYEAERTKWREGWDKQMNVSADRVITACRRKREYIDVFDLIGEDWEVSSNEFNKISHALYFEQKALAREQVIHAMGNRELHIVGIGSAKTDRKNIIFHSGRPWFDLSSLFCSSNINLNLTPWPRSCHHRVFQITASRGFVITDWKEDAIELFEPGKEAIYFKFLQELPDLIDRYANSSKERDKIALAGYHRFLGEHTAMHRMNELSGLLYELL